MAIPKSQQEAVSTVKGVQEVKWYCKNLCINDRSGRVRSPPTAWPMGGQLD